MWHPCWFLSLAFVGADSDDALLKMTITQQEFGRAGLPDLSSMTEEEQIAYAMQMSLQGAGECLVPALGPFPKGKPRRCPLCLRNWNCQPLCAPKWGFVTWAGTRSL